MRRGRRNVAAPPPGMGGGAVVDGVLPRDLDPDDDRFLSDTAEALRRRGLAPMARLWFESSRPLSGLQAQALHLVVPLSELFLPDDRFERFAGLVERRDVYDRFLDHLAHDGEAAS